MTLQCTRFYSHHELFRLAREPNKHTQLWFEYGPNLFKSIDTDHELRFVCHLIEGDIDSNMSEADREQHDRDVRDSTHTDRFEASQLRNRRSRPRHDATVAGCNHKKQCANHQLKPNDNNVQTTPSL